VSDFLPDDLLPIEALDLPIEDLDLVEPVDLPVDVDNSVAADLPDPFQPESTAALAVLGGLLRRKSHAPSESADGGQSGSTRLDRAAMLAQLADTSASIVERAVKLTGNLKRKRGRARPVG
jgi:hypothetical protein